MARPRADFASLPIELKAQVLRDVANQEEARICRSQNDGVLAPSVDSLSAASLVNREWRELALPHLIHTITSRSARAAVFKHSLSRKYSHLFKMATLEPGDVEDDEETFDNLLALLPTLPNLRRLTLGGPALRTLFERHQGVGDHLDFSPGAEMQEEGLLRIATLREVARSVDVLHLDDFASPQEMATVLSLWPSVRHLATFQTTQADVGADLSPMMSVLSGLKLLEHLEIQQVSSGPLWSPEALAALQLQRPPLTSLKLTTFCIFDSDLDFIKAFAPTLKKLELSTFRISALDHSPLTPLDLSHLTSLRLVCRSSEDSSLPVFAKLLPAFSICPLVSLTMSEARDGFDDRPLSFVTLLDDDKMFPLLRELVVTPTRTGLKCFRAKELGAVGALYKHRGVAPPLETPFGGQELVQGIEDTEMDVICDGLERVLDFGRLEIARSPRETNRSEDSAGTAAPPGEPLAASSLNSGYYSRFFVEIDKLGKGGSGTVHLVRHVLNGENLGLLPELLREVHLLEALQHPNLVQYHHVWVEECRLSPYGPPVPTLHLLMAYANAGDLGSFVARRSGGGTDCTPEERVRRFRMRNLASVHLLRVDEIISIFKDCCEGLAFLHGRNILHLDIKAENILLHWEEDALLPCAKISDLGSSDTTKESSRRTRCLILYLLSFFTLPYHETDDVDLLEKEIRAYPGFFIADALKLDHGTRHDLPTSLLRIISRLVHRDPSRRPSCVETIALLQIVSDQIESDESSLPVETSALVKQHSSSSAPLPPSPTSLALPSDLPFEDASEELTSLNLVASPESKRNLRKWALIRRRQPLTRLPLFKVYLAVGAVMKALSVQRLCRSAPLTPFALYAVLIPTLVDATLADPWLSLVLWGVHLVVLMGLGGLREGLCTISFVDLDGV
ncbi:hypothetical protein RQP46_011360 [Phenoliferia psychrophenolica]